MKHILLVDDEADIRDLLATFLTDQGYRITSVPGADEARRVVAKDPPELIISDLQLEDSDGLSMLAQLKASLPNTKMMLLTGVFIDPKVVREALSGTVASYLQKTTPLTRILEEVKHLLGE